MKKLGFVDSQPQRLLLKYLFDRMKENILTHAKSTKGGIVVTKAKESKQVEKARRKLKMQIEEEHKLITEAALREVSKDIKNWISRHAQERIVLKQKEISLFDENQHSAKVHSRYVKHLLQDLARPVPPKDENNLEGRITKA